MLETPNSLSIIIPAKNEEAGLSRVLPELRLLFPSAEILVVDDGSTDASISVCLKNNIRIISHPYSKGNGAAIKSGLRASNGEIIVCMDADGQHRPKDISLLLEKLADGNDMVVGSRSSSSQAGRHRGLANAFYNHLASWMVGHRVDDLTSGFRAMRRSKISQFIYLLPNGFSYPTTSTMSFFRAGYSVTYVPIQVQKRLAGTQSHIRLWQDGIRFLLIIFKIGTLYSPLKLFIPISSMIFVTGLMYYIYTFITSGRFTNMSGLLFTTAIMVFLMGLISEQITALMYKDSEKQD